MGIRALLAAIVSVYNNWNINLDVRSLKKFHRMKILKGVVKNP